LAARISSPSIAPQEINRRLDAVEYFAVSPPPPPHAHGLQTRPVLRRNVRESLKRTADIQRALQRMTLRRHVQGVQI
jgi:DNA mismatch repair ATPase MutS